MTMARGGVTRNAADCVDKTGFNSTTSVCKCGKDAGGQKNVFCNEGATCHVHNNGAKCYSHSDIAWRESNRGPDFDKCKYIHALAKPLEDFPLFIAPFEARAQTGASTPSLFVEWCWNADCLSPQFLNAGADAIFGAGGSRSPVSRRRTEAVKPRKQQARARGLSTTGFASQSIHGELKDPQSGLPREGKVMDLKFMSRLMEESEVQTWYYRTSHAVAGLEGPAEIVSPQHHDAKIQIDAYPDEILSIIPPVLFQSRCPMVDCKQHVPGLSREISEHLTSQTNFKCNEAYTCEFPDAMSAFGKTNFACVDRDQEINTDDDPSALWYGRRTVSLQIGNQMHGYPEFLDVMTLGEVYRDGQMRDTGQWLDLQSNAIVAINIFLSPRTRTGTLLYMRWEYDGPGKLDFGYTFYSYHQMSISTQDMWQSLVIVCLVMSILDIWLLFMDIVWRWRRRSRWCALVLRLGKVDDRHEDLQVVSSNLPLVNFWDLFDLALRAVLLVFLAQHYTHYYSPNLAESNVGKFEENMGAILRIPWGDIDIDYTLKVKSFFQIVVSFMEILNSDQKNRSMGYWIVLFCFFRIVVYCRVHPKMAVLYKTVETATSDLFHFMLIFCLLFGTLAFLAMWSFGGVLEAFGNFGNACNTQFRMIIGEFPFDDTEFAPDTTLYFVYLLVFAFVVFFLLLNFFLAIVVDSYASVQERVQKSVVEGSFISDISSVLIYPVLAFCTGLPRRRKLLEDLLEADIDGDNLNDEETEKIGEDVIVHPNAMVRCSIVKDDDEARMLMNFYLTVCPSLHIDHEQDEVKLEHEVMLERELCLDSLKHKLHQRAVPRRSSCGSTMQEKSTGKRMDDILERLDQVDSKLRRIVPEAENNREHELVENSSFLQQQIRKYKKLLELLEQLGQNGTADAEEDVRSIQLRVDAEFCQKL